ncbi:MAG: hypothetical protein AB1391_03610 [Candidatus Micrarchaeota archaeon]
MITSIFLENWRSHQNTSLTFRKGTNLLIGIMGSGKSSVLSGISFALFGTFPALEHRHLSLGEIIMHGKNSAKIILWFEWNREKYEIHRIISRGAKGISSDAEIRKEGKLMERGQNAVTKYIEHLLQIDYTLFSRAIYSEQNKIDRFLNIDPAKRKQEIDELLGLDKFEIARSNTVTLINRAKNTRKTFEEKFSRTRLEEIRKKEIETRNKCLTLEQKRKILLEEIEKNDNLYQQSNSKFSILKSKKEKADSLKHEIAMAKGAIKQLREQLDLNEKYLTDRKYPATGKYSAGEECSENREYENREYSASKECSVNEECLAAMQTKKIQEEKTYEENKKLLSDLQLKENALSKEAGILENKLEAAKNAKSEFECIKKELEVLLCGKKYEELVKEKQKSEHENIALAAFQQSLSSELKKLEEEARKITPALSKCPLCKSTLTKEGIIHVLNEYADEIAQKKKQLEDSLVQKQEKLKFYSEMDAKLCKLENLIQRQNVLEKELLRYQKLPEQIPELQSKIAKISELINSAKQNIEKTSISYQQTVLECAKLEEILSKKKKLAQIEFVLNKNESELKILEFNESEFENIRSEMEGIKLRMENVRIECESLGVQLKDGCEFLAFATSERNEMETIEKRISSLFKLEEELTIYKNALLETQIMLRKKVIDSVNTTMNNIWHIIYPYSDYKGLRMIVNEKGYVFEIYNEIWRPVELISGGERASLALTFRIALAAVLTPNMSLLVLDEPTHNLDKEAIGVLAHALQYSLPELVEQSFIITHDEGLTGSEFASTYKLSRDKNSNAPTKVEEV